MGAEGVLSSNGGVIKPMYNVRLFIIIIMNPSYNEYILIKMGRNKYHVCIFSVKISVIFSVDQHLSKQKQTLIIF
jgi:hypothetical protein